MAINIIDLFLSMAIWGTTTTVRLAGDDDEHSAAHTASSAWSSSASLLTGGWLTYPSSTRRSSTYDEVTLQTSRAGLQLPKHADVKMRGVIVGEVLDAIRRRRCRRWTWRLSRARWESIPSNVTARILPKTLFGEKYVELEIPVDASSRPIAAG